MQKNNLEDIIKKNKNNLNGGSKKSNNCNNMLMTDSCENLLTTCSTQPDTINSSHSDLRERIYESPKKIHKSTLSFSDFQISKSSDIEDNSDIHNNTKIKDTRYEFLLNIRDKEGRHVNDADYDNTTLYISDHDFYKMTPFEKQFWEIKKDYWDTIVFFKKGKFYELYEKDADIASSLFNFRLTERVNMRMAGFPESSLDDWICKFLEAGFKVARVDQSENMIAKKIREKGAVKDKIIRRELKEVITQGTIYDNNHLKTPYAVYTLVIRENQICENANCTFSLHFSILLFDAATLQIFYKTFCDDSNYNNLKNICVKYIVKEYLSQKKYPFISNYVKPDDKIFNKNLEFLNESENICYGFLYNYMKYLNRENFLKNCRFFKFECLESIMILDSCSIINLDLLSDKHNKTLFNVINNCSTPFGQRKLQSWMLSPLSDGNSIRKRQCLINYFANINLSPIIEIFKSLGDFERLFSKLQSGHSKFRDLRTFMEKLNLVVKIYQIIELQICNKNGPAPNTIKINCFEDLYDHNNLSVSYAPLHDLKKFIQNYQLKYYINREEIEPGKENSEEIASLINRKEELHAKLEEYLNNVKSNLQCEDINYKNIGKEIYQLEVPKHIKVPDEFFIVSATKSFNRYYTLNLKNLITDYIELEEKIFQCHGSLFFQAVNCLLESESLFFNIISDLSTIDCLISLAIFNHSIKGCLPVEFNKIEVRGLGNPIYKEYVKNDYIEDQRILILTGSNMAGKSTFMRTFCLNTILFHMGCNVFASEFKCPVFDRLYSRMGASDNLVRGESTFMVELLETSNILRNATSKSLVIMDELGRGTSTKDGKSIAKAVLSYLQNINCRVFFSTHYQNLVSLNNGFSTGFMNICIKNNIVIFLYKLVNGICEDSNGIHVAKLAGVPEEILLQAEKYKQEFKSYK